MPRRRDSAAKATAWSPNLQGQTRRREGLARRTCARRWPRPRVPRDAGRPGPKQRHVARRGRPGAMLWAVLGAIRRRDPAQPDARVFPILALKALHLARKVGEASRGAPRRVGLYGRCDSRDRSAWRCCSDSCWRERCRMGIPAPGSAHHHVPVAACDRDHGESARSYSNFRCWVAGLPAGVLDGRAGRLHCHPVCGTIPRGCARDRVASPACRLGLWCSLRSALVLRSRSC